MSAVGTEIGRRIRLARLRAGMSQGEAAARAGVDRRTLQSIELGDRGGRLETFLPICDILGVDLGDLVAGLPDVRDEALRDVWRSAA